nr:hypothetical protein [Cronobacter dublinensis]
MVGIDAAEDDEVASAFHVSVPVKAPHPVAHCPAFLINAWFI